MSNLRVTENSGMREEIIKTEMEELRIIIKKNRKNKKKTLKIIKERVRKGIEDLQIIKKRKNKRIGIRYRKDKRRSKIKEDKRIRNRIKVKKVRNNWKSQRNFRRI